MLFPVLFYSFQNVRTVEIDSPSPPPSPELGAGIIPDQWPRPNEPVPNPIATPDEPKDQEHELESAIDLEKSG